MRVSIVVVQGCKWRLDLSVHAKVCGYTVISATSFCRDSPRTSEILMGHFDWNLSVSLDGTVASGSINSFSISQTCNYQRDCLDSTKFGMEGGRVQGNSTGSMGLILTRVGAAPASNSLPCLRSPKAVNSAPVDDTFKCHNGNDLTDPLLSVVSQKKRSGWYPYRRMANLSSSVLKYATFPHSLRSVPSVGSYTL